MCFSSPQINIYILRRWDLKLTPGLTPRCSQGGWGWPPTAAWEWEGQKVGKGTTACFAFPLLCTRNFPPCQGSPVIFSVQDTQLFCNPSLHFHSYLEFDTIFILVTRNKVIILSCTHFDIPLTYDKRYLIKELVISKVKRPGDLKSGCLSLVEKLRKQGT